MSDGGKGYKEKNKASIGHKECQSMQTAMERISNFQGQQRLNRESDI